jgi:RNA polymerase sigma-B factor
MSTEWDDISTNDLFRALRAEKRRELRDYLIERHEGLVRHVAKGYMSSGESYEDIVSVGHLGLINAVDRFDPDRGTKFATFAVPTIRGEIQRYFRDRTWSIRVPRRIQELSLRVRETREQLSQKNRRAPTYAELALQLQVAEEDIIEAIEVGRQYEMLSIDASDSDSGEDEAGTLGERAGQVDPDIELVGQDDELRRALAHLPDRERMIMVLRFFREMSQQEVADRLGISQMHVSRLQQRALQHLRKWIQEARS